eukprot:gb/GFBE01035434.1/.p1 GENE.gb/GFBE01035434.1/~~gb/GFBE01035434.1/.p1  ORF type:complete len:191 (+),score=45.28 gb/GFBE01035434.1/:1-573(+)
MARTSACNVRVEEALRSISQPAAVVNWALLEPTKLDLHKAGCGGLDEMKSWLLEDKVLFGVLRFVFPRGLGDGPPIVKHLFVHWIGATVSPVRRGQWNSKLEAAMGVVRSYCDFAFKRTAHDAEDLDLTDLISELARLTYDKECGSRKLSLEWYLEGLPATKACVEVHNPDGSEPKLSLIPDMSTAAGGA